MKTDDSVREVLWELPDPSSGLSDVEFSILPRRSCSLRFDFESTEEEPKDNLLTIQGIEAYKCTYMHALTAELIESSYDKLVDMGKTEWLSEIQKLVPRETKPAKLKHLRICFDDGPCYEFVCQSFHVSRGR